MAHLIIRELGAERLVELIVAETSVGRSRQNEIKLDTEQASRRHCKVVKTDQGFRVLDTQSSNGTFVNGLKIDDKPLLDGDIIGIGQSTLTFRDGSRQPAAPSASPAPAPPPPVSDGATVPIPIQDRNVQILIQTIISAGASTDIDAFLKSALDNILTIAQAERGVLFMKDESGELKSRIARDRDGSSISEVSGISRSIPLKVFESKRAIYLLDTEQAGDAVPSQSVSIYHLRTVMCAPMRVGDKLLGVLYVDSHAKAREYSRVDLALFEAVTSYLALTIENVRAQTESKQREEQRRRLLEEENAKLRQALQRRSHLIGESAPMKSVYDTVRKVAPTDATVLLLGESGTGKEALAHVCHDLSPRSAGPFVIIDCAAIPESLLESELFGYEKGAFTGAQGTKPGKFELAQGGTLFLDEIGELSPALQGKLLRALEQRTITRVGATEATKIDARLVAATNRNLEEMVPQGKFRQDLLFRLKVVSVVLPPLRERGNDILLLAAAFLGESRETHGRPVKDFSEEAKVALSRHRWDGNIRELRHRVEQAVILTNNEYVSTEDLNLSGDGGVFRPLETARDAFEKSYIVKALAGNEFNVTHTARALGISRQHLQNLIRKYAISKVADAGD